VRPTVNSAAMASDAPMPAMHALDPKRSNNWPARRCRRGHRGNSRHAAKFKSEAEAPFPVLTDLDNGYALSLNLAIWFGTAALKSASEER
jgi:hypothetical protein